MTGNIFYHRHAVEHGVRAGKVPFVLELREFWYQSPEPVRRGRPKTEQRIAGRFLE
jgi:hypothetical protein